MADEQGKPHLQNAQYQTDIPAGWEPHDGAPAPSPSSVPKGFEKEKPSFGGVPANSIPKNYGFTVGNMYGNAVRGLGELGSGLYNLGNDVVNNPDWFTEKNGKLPTGAPGETSMLSKYVVQPALAEHNKAVTAPTGIESIGHSVAEAIPFIGPYAANLAEQAGTGDVGGALARGGTQVGVGAAVKYGPGLAKRGGIAVLNKAADAVADRVAQRTPQAPPPVAMPNNAPVEGMPPVSASERIAQMPQRGAPKTPFELGLKQAPPVQQELPLQGSETMEVEGPKQPEMPAVRKPMGTTVTPEEISSVEHVGGGKTGDALQTNKPAASMKEVNKTAQEFNEGLEKEPTTVKDIKDASHRQAIHALGDPENAMDFYNQKDGPAALQKLKGLSHEDLANYLEEKTGIVTDKSAMSRAGKPMGSAGKRIGMKMLLEKVSPSEVLSDLGGQ